MDDIERKVLENKAMRILKTKGRIYAVKFVKNSADWKLSRCLNFVRRLNLVLKRRKINEKR